MGAADYIAKPANPDLLKLRVLTQLELRRYRRKPAQPPGAGNGAHFNILVVDDIPENIHALVNALSSEYRVTVANNGLKAVELVQQVPQPVEIDPKIVGVEVAVAANVLEVFPVFVGTLDGLTEDEPA